ncbi:MAG: TetR/AcrR family transcriptional regulator [Novosphingobium sp.]|nr:TetR/AcrR family transcriptional regulator [Novosphingobium sp.]
MELDDATTMTRGKATRARILNCALRLMWRHGYSEIGINRLIEEAGVFKGSFYHFFPSKMDLLLAVYDHLWAVQRRQIQHIYKANGSPEEALLEHIRWVCRAQIQTKNEQGYVPGLFHMAAGITLLDDNPALAEKVRGMTNEHNTFLIDTMKKISLRGPEAAEQLGGLLATFVGGAILNARVSNSIKPIHAIERLASAIVDHLKASDGSEVELAALYLRQA